MKNKNTNFLIILIAIGVVLGVGYKGFGWDNTFGNLINLSSTDEPTLISNPVREEAWDTFTKYLAFAEAHDIENLKLLSHQVSPTCSDPNLVAECNNIMDSVAIIGSYLDKGVFDTIIYDDKQVVVYSGGPNRVFI